MPPTRAVAAADELRRRILDGVYPGGMQLRQAVLAEEMGISRIPFREALIQLEAEGLVQIVAHKGAVVTGLSSADVEELVELRALLEPKLLRRSAPRLTEADFEALDAILAEYSAHLRNNRIERWGELNTRLHALLYSHAGQPRAEQIVATLLQSNDRYARIQISQTDGRARAEREHAQIVALCRRGLTSQACKLLSAHIRHAGEVLVALIRKNAGETVRSGNGG